MTVCPVCLQEDGRHFTVPHVDTSPVVARRRAEEFRNGLTARERETFDRVLADAVARAGRADLALREAVGDYLTPHESRSHPGSGGDPDAAQRLQRVRDAYAEAVRREPPKGEQG